MSYVCLVDCSLQSPAQMHKGVPAQHMFIKHARCSIALVP